jgi:hypothetical protein
MSEISKKDRDFDELCDYVGVDPGFARFTWAVMREAKIETPFRTLRECAIGCAFALAKGGDDVESTDWESELLDMQ